MKVNSVFLGGGGGIPMSSTNKTYRCDITEILFKVVLNKNKH